MPARGQSKNLVTHPGPKLSLNQAKQSWFVLDNEPLPVSMCSTQDFKAFIRPYMKAVKDPDTVAMARQRTLDIYERWFLLCNLSKARTALYQSQSDAEQAIEQALQAANPESESRS
jgi:hypothetical protein